MKILDVMRRLGILDILLKEDCLLLENTLCSSTNILEALKRGSFLDPLTLSEECRNQLRELASPVAPEWARDIHLFNSAGSISTFAFPILQTEEQIINAYKLIFPDEDPTLLTRLFPTLLDQSFISQGQLITFLREKTFK
jgi:hypothetical protein